MVEHFTTASSTLTGLWEGQLGDRCSCAGVVAAASGTRLARELFDGQGVRRLEELDGGVEVRKERGGADVAEEERTAGLQRRDTRPHDLHRPHMFMTTEASCAQRADRRRALGA